MLRIIFTFLIFWVYLNNYVEAFFEYCDHEFTVNAYGKAYVNSPYYSTAYSLDTCQYPSRLPCRYTSGSSCRYQIISPTDFNIYVQCNISLDSAGNQCSTEYFYLSVDGDKNLHSSEYFCGNGQLERQSTFNELTIAFTSSSPNNNGWFTCYVEAVPSTLQPTCECGWSFTSKITGGTEAKINEFSSMAALVDQNDLMYPFCGATIIHNRWGITAAHCFDSYRSDTRLDPQYIKLLVGEHDLKTNAESPFTEYYDIYDVVIHNQYRTEKTDHDIALIKTYKDIRWSRGVGPVCLPFKWVDYSFVDLPVDITGWGTTSFAGPRSTTLQKAVINVVNPQKCYDEYQEKFDNTRQMCTLGGYKDACQYDSGGPVFWRNNRMFLLGVVNFGKPCGTYKPSVNTRVTSYLNWIEYQTQETYCKVYN